VEFAPDADLTFEISFDVAPQIEVPRVGGFTVERPRVAIGDKEVQEVLDRVREQEGTWVPAESGKPEEGDRVSVRIQRLSVEGDEPRPYELTLGKGEAIPQIEEAIGTLEVGTEGDFTITFPDDFPNEERRGDTDALRIFLDGRKRLELAELNDDFAAKVGDFETLEALKVRIREDLEKEAEEEADAVVRGGLIEQLLAANPFDVPESMVEQFVRSFIGEDEELSDEDFAKALEELRPRAEHTVKRYLVIEELAESRSLTASEDEVEERIETLAERSGTPPGELYARLQKAGRIEGIERDITERKVFDFLRQESTITETD
jgi:trigger factor